MVHSSALESDLRHTRGHGKRRLVFSRILSTSLCLSAALWMSIAGGFAGSIACGEDEIVRELLTNSWDDSLASKEAAEQLLRDAQRTEPNATRAFAAGLTLINHGKYTDAIEWMARALVADETHADARRANAWLLARTKQYNRSMDELSLLVANLDDGDLTPDHRNELVLFTGRMMGFYAGPANDAVSPAILERIAREIPERLTDEEVEVFNAERDRVTEKYTALLEEKLDEDIDAEEEAETEQERLIDELEKRIEELKADAARVIPIVDEVRQDAKQELESIQGKDEPLARQSLRLETRAASLDSELSYIVREIRSLELRASREKDDFYRDSYLRDADRLRLTATRIEGELIGVQRELSIIASQRRSLQIEFARTEARYNSEIERLQDQLTTIERSMRRAQTQLDRARRGPETDRRRSRSLNAQLSALTTYDEFPLEEKRRELLDRL